MSGITGIGRSERFFSDPEVDETAERAVWALADRPHGLFAVDMLWSEDGTVYVTETNVGRFASGSFSHTITTEMNAPYTAMLLGFGIMPDFDPPLMNPFKEDLVTIKGRLHETSYVEAMQIEREVAEYEEMMRELGGKSVP